MRVRYPRTPHLPWSPGASSDDVRAEHLASFEGHEVVVTEKLDGENTTLYRDGLHARSPDSAHHPSRDRVKALQARLAPAIPAGHRLCGENLYARHSIAYDALESWFYLFSAWDERDRCLPWDDTVALGLRLGLPVPPVLWRGRFDERALRALRVDPARQEGFVVRRADGFDRADFGASVAKWVRPHHVRPGGHWMFEQVVPNGLGPTACWWEVRSGGTADAEALGAASGLPAPDPEARSRLALVGARGPELGEARLEACLAALVPPVGRPDRARAAVLPALLSRLGRSGRRAADLAGLREHPARPYPDELRRGGLASLARSVDLRALHAVAEAAASGWVEREAVAWSAMVTEDLGWFEVEPHAALRDGLREALAGAPSAVQDRVWSDALAAFSAGRLRSAEEALAFGHRWLSDPGPLVEVLVGASGSGKSSWAAAQRRGSPVVSLDELREAAGDRADQSRNDEVVREAVERLRALLRGGAPRVVWDATSITRLQRDLPKGVAVGAGAAVRFTCFVVDEQALPARNRGRRHAVPEEVLGRQLDKLTFPWAHEANQLAFVDADGREVDRTGTLAGP